MVQVPADRGGMAGDRIAFVGHATVLIELDGVRLLTDPLLRDRLVHLRRQSAPVERDLVAEIDAVLLSHLHRDHLDLASLRTLGADTSLLAPAGAGAWLSRRGFTHTSELRAGDRTNVGPIEVRAVQARHDGRRHPGGRRAETLGYVVRGGRMTIYFAGDTELFDGMADIGAGTDAATDESPARRARTRTPQAQQLDVALVPVAGWGPRLGPGHMDALQAAHAVALLAPRVAIPIHWGTFLPIGGARRYGNLLFDPPRLFARHVERLAPDVQVRILEPGEQMMLPTTASELEAQG